jgi:PTH1 family peptidyl-tRNA hydrolase
MKLIVGLGNPGPEYAATRHNVGWRVVDELRADFNLPAWSKKFKGQFAKGADLVLLKPETFMNLSGESVQEALHFYKLDPKTDLIVIHDDLDLPVGTLRLTGGAGPGGHNGVKSIIEKLGLKEFARVRVGIGHPVDRTPVEDYVLQKFRAEDAELAEDTETKASVAVTTALKDGLPAAMNKFNS